MPDLALADVIAALRSELYAAMVEGQGSVLQFEVGDVDLEFQVVLERTGSGHAGIKFWVVELGAEGAVSSSSTQVIKMRLKPLDAVTGRAAKVARRTISRPDAPSDPVEGTADDDR